MEHITYTRLQNHRTRREQKSVIRRGAGSARLEVVVLPSIEGPVDSPKLYMCVCTATLQKERKQREKMASGPLKDPPQVSGWVMGR
jgi:hypothetical protein